MLMINIGVMVIYGSGMIEDPLAESIATIATNSLSNFTSIGNSTNTLIFSGNVLNVSNIANPVTQDSPSSSVIFKSDNPFSMIFNLLKLVLGTIVFGLIYILISAQAPSYVIWLIGVPFTLIYMISGLMFIRSGN
jgi:hypothetical protein